MPAHLIQQPRIGAMTTNWQGAIDTTSLNAGSRSCGGTAGALFPGAGSNDFGRSGDRWPSRMSVLATKKP